MRSKSFRDLSFLSLIFIILIVACSPATPLATPTQEQPTQPPEPKATDVPTGLVTELSDLKNAIIQVEAQGTFVDPEFGYITNAAGRGSGFIIDPSGIAVTNNHVVTGAALLKVWIGGDTSKVYNARVLGVSECSDLAVIDIQGEGFPYLSWYEAPAMVGLEVYAAGFPLGDPEYTLTKGIVSKEKADGETSWASVDSVIEHTSTINPGNSGGPLVDANAQVVGVNYSGISSTNQYFAIDRGTALSVIDQLRAEKDVDSIGINGQAVSSEDGSITGVWVSSVDSGSLADKTGVKAGDIVTSLENLFLAQDGTMKDYCDVLRTHGPNDTLGLQILRWDTQEVLEGQLNGRKLEVAYSFTEPSSTEPVQDSGTPTGSALPENCTEGSLDGYMTCWDDTGTIQVDVPEYWTDVNGSAWGYDDQTIGVALTAAPNISDFLNYFDAEGVFFGASDTFAQIGGYVEFLDYYTESYRSDCKFNGRFDYNDSLYRGKYDSYSACGGPGGYDAYVLSAVDIVDPTSKIILLEIQAYPGDTITVEDILSTFFVLF